MVKVNMEVVILYNLNKAILIIAIHLCFKTKIRDTLLCTLHRQLLNVVTRVDMMFHNKKEKKLK